MFAKAVAMADRVAKYMDIIIGENAGDAFISRNLELFGVMMWLNTPSQATLTMEISFDEWNLAI